MWISELKLLLKHLLDTNANERFYSHLFLLHTIVPVLQPNSCLTNKTVSQVNSTNTTDNTDNGWCDHKSVSRSHVTKKKTILSHWANWRQSTIHSTVIDLNLNINHLIRSALQYGSNMWEIFSNQEELFNEEKEIYKMNLIPDVSLTTKRGLIINLMTASKWHSGLSTQS